MLKGVVLNRWIQWRDYGLNYEDDEINTANFLKTFDEVCTFSVEVALLHVFQEMFSFSCIS